MHNAAMQNDLATLLLIMVFGGVVVASAYIWVLTRFFKELRQKEPEVWQQVGSPTLVNMLALPMLNFRKFYIFLPFLAERRAHGSYKHATFAYAMLLFGLFYLGLALFVVLALVASEFL